MSLTCSSCGAEHEPGARFCSACGSPLFRACPSCGAEQPAGAAFCSACGFAFGTGVRRAAATDDREERRLVTLLFADLAGSTALGEQLDPEDVRAVQSDLVTLVEEEVERHGGIVEKFVGDAVLAVFGIPLAHENDAERALLAALAVRDRFPELAGRVLDRHGTDLGLRIGVNTGEVVAGRAAAARGELMVSGDAVNVAARLQQHAVPGTVLVGARTRVAALRGIRFREAAPVAPKGRSEPVEVWEALEATSDPARRGLDGLVAPLIGRDDELAILTAVASRAERERVPQLVTLYGPAGVGKSRLLAEFVDRLGEARMLKGRCLPYGDGITYWPLAEAAKGHAGIRDTDPPDDALAKLAAAVTAVLPGDEATHVVDALARTIGLAPTSDGDAVGVRTDLHDAWSRYVAALGRERPTVLAVEDIHWASEPLLDLLEHLADALDDTAVTIVCPARPELLDARPAWGAGKQNATALNLVPLDAGKAAELVAALLEAEVPDGARDTIVKRAEGNPFFVEEIIRMLVERGALVRQNGGWIVTDTLSELPIPDSVHGVIAARLDLLSAAPRDALRRCSVIGRIFWPAALGVDDELVAPLARRGLVSEHAEPSMAGFREFRFKHALTRDVAYATLPRAERRGLHVRVADWIEEVAPERREEMSELVAYHLTEAIGYGADVNDEVVSRAFDALIRAGTATLGRAAVASAGRMLTRARELARTPHERGIAELALARVAVASRADDEGLAHLEAAKEDARASGDEYLLADILGWESRARWLAGHWSEALRVADEAASILEGGSESRELARVLARRSQLEMLRGLPVALDHAREAADLARRVGDDFAELIAEINLQTARSFAGVAPSEERMLDLARRALEGGYPDESYRAVVNYMWAAAAFVPAAELESAVARGQELLAGTPDIEAYDQYLDVSLGMTVYLPCGRWDELDIVLARVTVPRAGGTLLAWSAVAGAFALARGDLATVDSILEDAWPAALASQEPQRILPLAGPALARAVVAGDVEAVRERSEAVVALPATAFVSIFAPLAIPRAFAAAGLDEVLMRFRDTLRELPADRRAGDLGTLVATAEGLAALRAGDAAAATGLLAEAVDVSRGRGRDYEAACLSLELARALETDSRADEAAATREHAEAFFAELGCVNPY
jgi:class 3 adenylate cyclase